MTNKSDHESLATSKSFLQDERSSPRSKEGLAQAGDRLQDCLGKLPTVLMEFALVLTVDFLATEPPEHLSHRHRVFLAGLAELICNHLALQVPAWTEKREYFLSAEWDVRGDSSPTEDTKDGANPASPEFTRRKIIF